MKTKPLNFDELLEKSRGFNGGLGVLTFAVIRGLRQAGTKEAEVKVVLEALTNELPKMTDKDREVILDVVYARMSEERKKR